MDEVKLSSDEPDDIDTYMNIEVVKMKNRLEYILSDLLFLNRYVLHCLLYFYLF